jgi:Type IV leader peptidase family
LPAWPALDHCLSANEASAALASLPRAEDAGRPFPPAARPGARVGVDRSSPLIPGDRDCHGEQRGTGGGVARRGQCRAGQLGGEVRARPCPGVLAGGGAHARPGGQLAVQVPGGVAQELADHGRVAARRDGALGESGRQRCPVAGVVGGHLHGHHGQGAAELACLGCAVPLAFIDAEVRRLPDALTGAAFVGTVLLLLACAAASGDWHVLVRAVLGGVAMSGFYLVLVLVSPSGMGMGDVKAAAGLGTMLAWRGWGALIVGGFAGFLLAAVYASALLISGRATRKYQIPFGPFMVPGAFLVVLAWHL